MTLPPLMPGEPTPLGHKIAMAVGFLIFCVGPVVGAVIAIATRP